MRKEIKRTSGSFKRVGVEEKLECGNLTLINYNMDCSSCETRVKLRPKEIMLLERSFIDGVDILLPSGKWCETIIENTHVSESLLSNGEGDYIANGNFLSLKNRYSHVRFQRDALPASFEDVNEMVENEHDYVSRFYHDFFDECFFDNGAFDGCYFELCVFRFSNFEKFSNETFRMCYFKNCVFEAREEDMDKIKNVFKDCAGRVMINGKLFIFCS